MKTLNYLKHSRGLAPSWQPAEFRLPRVCISGTLATTSWKGHGRMLLVRKREYKTLSASLVFSRVRARVRCERTDSNRSSTWDHVYSTCCWLIHTRRYECARKIYCDRRSSTLNIFRATCKSKVSII